MWFEGSPGKKLERTYLKNKLVIVIASTQKAEVDWSGKKLEMII
jgi:hypothetical protein